MSPLLGFRTRQRVARLRREAGGALIKGGLNLVLRAGKLHPQASLKRHGVERISNLAYGPLDDDAHRLDVYRPLGSDRPTPSLMYVHGGGFHILSKDTHWMMGLGFARLGFTVFSVNYRLAPKHRFPAAIEDVCAAAVWIAENAEAYGADPNQLVLAGESAGANLVTALTLACSRPRNEPWAAAVWEAGVKPLAVMPACGLLQVSAPERLLDQPGLPTLFADRILGVARGYLPALPADPALGELADPLVALEGKGEFDLPLPPFFVAVGSKDPIVEDSRRLKAALDARAVPCELAEYPGQGHGFHLLTMRKAAQACWSDHARFLARYV